MRIICMCIIDIRMPRLAAETTGAVVSTRSEEAVMGHSLPGRRGADKSAPTFWDA